MAGLSHHFSSPFAESPSSSSSSSSPMLDKMIAVEVPSMGRMIVHRSEALQLFGMMNVDDISATKTSSDAHSTSSSSVGSSAGMSIESNTTAHSFVTTSSQDDAGIIKQTPANSYTVDVKHLMHTAATGLTRRTTGLPLLLSTQGGSSCKPRLDGLDMPTLEWPDTTNGPWADAGKPSEKKRRQRRQAIARWLDEESDEESQQSSNLFGYHQHQQFPQHPMVAKAIMDRKRKEETIRALAFESMTNLSPFKDGMTPKKRGGKLKRRIKADMSTAMGKAKAKKVRRRKGGVNITPRLPDDASEQTHFSTPSHIGAGGLAQIGCQCGRNDDGTPMVQCDECNMWYHMSCVGLPESSGTGVLGEEWFCYVCYATISSMLTPSSAITLSSSGTGGLVTTPNFPRSAALAGQQLRLSQGQLPVFSQPLDTPFAQQRRDDGHAHVFSSGIALAPSPVMLSGASLETVARRARHAPAGRSRASRTGWHLTEPGSPLERKGNGVSHRRKPSSTANSALVSGRISTEHGLSSNKESEHFQASHDDCSTPRGRSSAVDQMSAYLRTPSPRLVSSVTPTQQRDRLASNTTGGVRTSGAMSSGGRHARETSAMHDFDDIFSTPSRFMHLSSGWGQQPSSVSTSVATSGRRTREDSAMSINGSSTTGGAAQQHTSWGLSTPTRHLMDIGFGSDYSGAAGGLPSLVHSSGGLEMGEFAGWQQLQNSPTTGTRAFARARQQSAGGNGSSGRRMETSSMRDREYTPEHGAAGASSSSPFPKTPTFHTEPFYPSAAGVGHRGRAHGGDDAGRRLSAFSSHAAALSPAMASSSPSTARAYSAGRLAKSHNGSNGSTDSLLSSLQAPLELSSNSNARKESSNASINSTASQHQHGVKARHRNASTDLMAGLGIGLDLNDVMDWM